MRKKIRVCPVCETPYVGYPAISRKDNKTEICPECGVREALEAWIGWVNSAKEANND